MYSIPHARARAPAQNAAVSAAHELSRRVVILNSRCLCGAISLIRDMLCVWQLRSRESSSSLWQTSNQTGWRIWQSKMPIPRPSVRSFLSQFLPFPPLLFPCPLLAQTSHSSHLPHLISAKLQPHTSVSRLQAVRAQRCPARQGGDREGAPGYTRWSGRV